MGVLSGPDAPPTALIDTCVHCGFCLPTCPTYLLWGEEMDSPRGRIYLMKAGVEGRAELTPSFVTHFDNCLGCLACVSACPSGVQYGPLIEKTRAQIEQKYPRPAADRWFRRVLMAVVPYPGRMRLAMLPLALMGGVLRRLLGAEQPGGSRQGLLARLRSSLSVAPPVTLSGLFASTRAVTPAQGKERLKVAMLTGCVQRLAFGHVNEATVRVLSAEGCQVLAPAAQGCCGALPLHSGHIDQARALAKRTIEVFERSGADRIVVNAAGCGSAMKDYGELFAGDPAWADHAHAFSAKVRDVSQVLTELGPQRAARHPLKARVAYHDACHLAHGQGVRAEPRTLLQAIPGVELVSPAESEICCGSAGIYNLVQPGPAADLGDRKARHLAALSPDMIATANPGCTLQIAAAGRRLGHNWPVFHPVELIDASMRGVDPRRPAD
ncbi:MAG TPA: heterodisulfide reductase-related iron-sulfur binding cluster [Vicinamibacterales bacterium]|jgi:glycolate oxidase iron-sulfur subunit|nr:heterodisulfide reductase-related iron-sulfur binding cluster [Vicinamibacterales bacterium]